MVNTFKPKRSTVILGLEAGANVLAEKERELMDRAAFHAFMHNTTDPVARRHGQTILTDEEIDAVFERYVRNGNGGII